MELINELTDDRFQGSAGAAAGGGVEDDERPLAYVIQVPQCHLSTAHSPQHRHLSQTNAGMLQSNLDISMWSVAL